MKQPIIALVGLSGVGKSTALRSLGQTIQFQHVQASALIKQAREDLAQMRIASDDLRSANIGDNQALLIDGFKAARDLGAPLIILDGHTVIDTPNGLVRIDPPVFRSLELTHLVFMSEEPRIILQRRTQDMTRSRPQRTIDELAYQQEVAVLAAFDVSLQLSIPMIVTRGSDGVAGAIASAIGPLTATPDSSHWQSSPPKR